MLCMLGEGELREGGYRDDHFIPTNVSLNVKFLCFDLGVKTSEEGEECTRM